MDLFFFFKHITTDVKYREIYLAVIGFISIV